jgi:hypothetical protein
MLKEGFKFLHWNYFLVLESDLEQLSKYIEFADSNFKTYSQKLAHLLLAAGSEVDVVLKGICKKIDSQFKNENIECYRELINSEFPKLHELNVRLPRYGLEISPWDNWKNNKTPKWWRDYNQVKHNRDEYFSKANLWNAIASMAGLFLAVLYFYKEEAENGELFPDPNVFRIQDDCYVLNAINDRGLIRSYIL